MDARNIELLALSFARVSANREEAARLFCARLLTTAPHLRGLFNADLQVQQTKLIGSLAQIVDFYRVGVDAQRYFTPLGRVPKTYGTDRAHFDVVGDALIFMLAQVLGEDFTPEIRTAWVLAYTEVASIMLHGAEGPRAQPMAASA